MGLSYTDARQMLLTQRRGGRFDSVLMIGRQGLHLDRRQASALAEEFGLPPRACQASRGGYADDFLRLALHADRVDAMDASEHEGATIIHDLNDPVDPGLYEAYDSVIDGGSLEHIFNVPVALANLMRMATVGGRLFSLWPANNLCGHGFFQFSPEFAFRVFSEAHGFEAERVSLVESRFPSVELTPRRLVLDVKDPDLLGHRVLRTSMRPALLLVQARKLRHLDDPFAVPPQQSDYSARWAAHADGSATAEAVTSRVSARLPAAVTRVLVGGRELVRASRFNRRVYTRSS